MNNIEYLDEIRRQRASRLVCGTVPRVYRLAFITLKNEGFDPTALVRPPVRWTSFFREAYRCGYMPRRIAAPYSPPDEDSYSLTNVPCGHCVSLVKWTGGKMFTWGERIADPITRQRYWRFERVDAAAGRSVARRYISLDKPPVGVQPSSEAPAFRIPFFDRYVPPASLEGAADREFYETLDRPLTYRIWELPNNEEVIASAKAVRWCCRDGGSNGSFSGSCRYYERLAAQARLGDVYRRVRTDDCSRLAPSNGDPYVVD